jgi:hypothetical protein
MSSEAIQIVSGWRLCAARDGRAVGPLRFAGSFRRRLPGFRVYP